MKRYSHGVGVYSTNHDWGCSDFSKVVSISKKICPRHVVVEAPKARPSAAVTDKAAIRQSESMHEEEDIFL